MTFIKYYLTLLLAFSLQPCIAQTVLLPRNTEDDTRDASRRAPALRIGAGLTPDLYGEAGISFHRYRKDRFTKSTSSAFYAAVEAKPTRYLDRGFLLLSPKLGYEVSARGLGAGIEAKYQSDGRNKDAVIMPKAGFSLMGLANLMYGYNISFNEYPFPGVGRHQFSLIFNLYRKPLMGEKQ